MSDRSDRKVRRTGSVFLAQWYPAQHATRTLETGAQAGDKREKKRERRREKGREKIDP